MSNIIDAQFSAYFQVANALLYGSTTGIQAYEKLKVPEILSICNKTTAETDSSMSGFASSLRVEWADGKIDETRMDYPLGETQHPFTRDEVDEKILDLAEPVYGETQARTIVQVVDGLESHSVGDLLQLVR